MYRDGDLIGPAEGQTEGGIVCIGRKRGVLWTFTVQRFAPKSPYMAPDAGFAPFVVGYVETPTRRVEAIIDLADVDEAHIGLELERVPGPGVPHYRRVTS